MNIAAITNTQIQSPYWALDSNKTALENLQTLLSEINSRKDVLEENKLPAEEHLAKKEELQQLLETTGLNLQSAELMGTLAQEAGATKIQNRIEKKTDEHLLRELLTINMNQPEVKAKAHSYGEAWPEVLGGYALKISIYRMEQMRRALQPA
jgi:hypothetical protein